MIARRTGLVLALCALVLAACGQKTAAPTGKTPDVLNFSILSAESQTSMATYWQPLIDDMQKTTGLKVKAFYATNYTALITAMQYNQVQVGWFSALPALEATRRADGEVIGRIVDAGGSDAYTSVLIAKKGSGITLDKVMSCDKTLNFGLGDAKSTSGTLAPMAYLFTPAGIDPAECFKTVRSASHQANLFAVANGVADVATNNSVGLSFARKDNPAAAAKIEVIWRSPPLPESSIVLRKDLDPAIKEKLRQFFLTYGTAPGAEGDRQRKVLEGLEYGGFRAADDSYLDPIREMEASEALAEARKSGDAARISAAKAAYDQITAEATARRAKNPDA